MRGGQVAAGERRDESRQAALTWTRLPKRESRETARIHFRSHGHSRRRPGGECDILDKPTCSTMVPPIIHRLLPFVGSYLPVKLRAELWRRLIVIGQQLLSAPISQGPLEQDYDVGCLPAVRSRTGGRALYCELEAVLWVVVDIHIPRKTSELIVLTENTAACN